MLAEEKFLLPDGVDMIQACHVVAERGVNRASRAAMKHLDVAVAVVFREFRILITRRKAGGVLGGYWEFPGGKCEPGEAVEDCLRRELFEELAIRVRPVVCMAPITHQYPDRLICLHPFLCTHEAGEPTPLACDEIRWVAPRELRTFAFPAANQQLIEQVIAAFPEPLASVSMPARAHTRSPRQNSAAVNA